MANLFFPQLATGALAQYPIQKTRVYRTITNLLTDGTLIMAPDNDATLLNWKLTYSGLSGDEIQQIQTLFRACTGPLTGFTFIDPTDNMLVASGDFTAPAWSKSTLVTATPGATDPMGGNNATTVTNASEAPQLVTQSINVPANYVYCFSVYVASTQATSVELVRQGPSSGAVDVVAAGPGWSRVITSGRLNDPGTVFTVGI